METTFDDTISAQDSQTVNSEDQKDNFAASDQIICSMSSRITILENQLKLSKQENNVLKRKLQKMIRERKDFEIRLSKYFGDDQLAFLRGKKMVKWSSKTIAKGLYLRRKGKSVLESVRLHIAPLPCLRTLNRHVESLKFFPGIIESNVQVLKKKCEGMKYPENFFYLGFDEMSTIPGVSKDPSTKLYLGNTTLPSNFNILSDQVLLFVVMGLQTRIKSNVAFHFTKKGITTGEHLKIFIFELIIYLENELNILIKGICFDLSALDCSLIKLLNIKFNIENKQYYIEHPNRKDDILLLSPDGTHISKNLNQGLILSTGLQQSFSLDSRRAKLKDVEKIFKADGKNNFKLLPKVNEIVVHTKHFAKMDANNAVKFHSTDVISSLKLKSQDNTLNATAFVLSCFNLYHKIITSREGWTINNLQKYNDDVEFLQWFADDFLPNVKIGKGNMKSVFGARMGIFSVIHLSKDCFDKGYKEFKPSRVLTNPVENQFSILRSLTPKPSASHVAQSLRIMSLCPFQFNPVSSTYDWDEEDPKSIDYLKFLKEMIENPQDPTEYEMQMFVSIEVPDAVGWNQVMKDESEYSAFICHMSLLINEIINKQKCNQCAMWIIAPDDHSFNRLEEYQLLSIRLDMDTEHYKYTPSVHIIKYCLQLEFLYQQLSLLINPAQEDFELNFQENVPEIKEASNSVHCFELLSKVATKFISFRLKSALHSRHIQKAQKFSSKTLSTIN